MRVGTVVVSVTAVGFAFVVGIDGAVGVDTLNGAVVLKARAAIGTVFLHVAPGLRANAHAVSSLDVLDVGADADGFADDLVANDRGCASVSATSSVLLECMHIR